MKSNTEILREHIDLVRGIDEGLASAALGAIGGALAATGLSSWFNRKDTTPDKPSSSGSKSSGSSSDDIDIGDTDIKSPTKSLSQGARDVDPLASVNVDRLGYSPADYQAQDIVPVKASLGLPQGTGNYDRGLRAIEKYREQYMATPVTMLGTWNYNGASLGLWTNNNNYQKAFEVGSLAAADDDYSPLFAKFGLKTSGKMTIPLSPNRFGGAYNSAHLLSKPNGRDLIYAETWQIVPFRTEKGPGLRAMNTCFLGPKSVWDDGGRDQFQALFSSFELDNGARPLEPKDD
jgi:hypothetical protein